MRRGIILVGNGPSTRPRRVADRRRIVALSPTRSAEIVGTLPRRANGWLACILRMPVTTRNKTTRRRNRVRIIGGRWRGRRIDVVAGAAVRPTPDRVRETLFNWLAPRIEGACCLDLFAGTGVLGLEALSRGAADVVFVEKDRRLVRSLRDVLAALESEATVVERAASSYLGDRASRAFDIVFLDPPYATPLEPIITRLPDWLGDSAILYVERSRSGPSLSAVAGLVPELGVTKEARAGDVLYGLLAFERE